LKPWGVYLRGRGTSLGGVRPKCTVLDDDGILAIGKFPSVRDERAMPPGEVLAMHLAKAAGINAAETRLADSDGVPVALVRRFDRTKNRKRLMYISAATMLGVERNDSEEHAYTEIVDAPRVHGAAVQADIEELWRRLAFSILITNVDALLHLVLNYDFVWSRFPWPDLSMFSVNFCIWILYVSNAARPALVIRNVVTGILPRNSLVVFR